MHLARGGRIRSAYPDTSPRVELTGAQRMVDLPRMKWNPVADRGPYIDLSGILGLDL